MKMISSRQNPAFKVLRDLVGAPRDRRAHGLAWCEGDRLAHTFAQAARDRPWFDRGGLILVASSAPILEGLDPEWQAIFHETWVLSPELFAEISQIETSPGWGLVVPAPLHDVTVAASNASACTPQTTAIAEDVVVLDRLQDPGNVGAILRSAAAAGVTEVWNVSGSVDVWAPKVVRSAMGAHAVLRLSAPMTQEQVIAAAQNRNIPLMATGLGAHTVSLFSEALTLAPPLGWIFGQEADGVSAGLLSAARRVTIPMAPTVESLNVAAAASICLFETMRRRGQRR